MKKKGNDDIEDNDDETAKQEKVLVHQKCLPSAAVHRPTICILISYIFYLLVFVSVPLFVFLYLMSSYIALRAGLSTQSSCAPRVFKDGGDDQRESQVELLLQRQIHRHTKTNTQRHW